MAAKKTSVDAGPETSAPKSLGELIKEKRLAKGLSQKEVAERLGYASAQYVSDWERDR
jgi:DNA-binding transcriptional regulator YiaG